MKKILNSAVLAVIILVGCSKSNEVTESQTGDGGTGGNNGDCDTVNMKYSTNIQPILKANCYSCHGNGLSQNGVSLDTYSQVKQQADNGNLVGTITHATGFHPMPQGAPKLDECDINKIKAWIAAGIQNN